MTTDILTFGEALVEIMRTGLDQPLDTPGPFSGPYPSGAPFIFAAQAARLGAKVAVIGSVGRDGFGDCLLKQLQTDNIDISNMRTLDTHATGVAFVSYNGDGSRDFIFHISHAAAGQLYPDMLSPAQFEGLRCLHLMGSTLSIHQQALETGLRALELAQQAGTKISFDPNLRPQLLATEKTHSVFTPFVAAADILMPTAAELKILTGYFTSESAINALLAAKPGRIIVVTDGANGCTVYTRGSQTHIPSFPVEEVDPTGAGDCFDAGFLVQLLSGKTPEQAALFANACGALAVTQQGPMIGAQPIAAVQAFINAHA